MESSVRPDPFAAQPDSARTAARSHQLGHGWPPRRFSGLPGLARDRTVSLQVRSRRS